MGGGLKQSHLGEDRVKWAQTKYREAGKSSGKKVQVAENQGSDQCCRPTPGPSLKQGGELFELVMMRYQTYKPLQGIVLMY
jgi:hypothetical protein